MDRELEDSYLEMDWIMALPEEDMDSYYARRANPDEQYVASLEYLHWTLKAPS